MLTGPPTQQRDLRTVTLSSDLVVVGGGLAGICAAIAAARLGAQVTLIHDRPVLGGNSSSEVRLWVLGATAHMTNNNRWAREGGLLDEILMENIWRNPEGNAVIFDTVLLEKALAERNLTVLLNTAVCQADKAPDGSEKIASVTAFCSQNSTKYVATAPLFCDASGDGVLGYLSGAAFRMGAESSGEFGELFAPSAEYGELLGHSIYFYSKDTGAPVRFVAPAYAYTDIERRAPRYRSFTTSMHGCRLWWIEWGGRLDTVHETESIKWELWRVVYGVWNYIKNSGKFPDAENLTLEWVGAIPGKRESRRFEGDYMLRQQDIVEQTRFEDVVAFGGWSIDLHPADGIFSERPGCNQWHSKGIYGIPYRCYYSRNVPNLFLAGRIISATHVAFGSSRVMATCGQGGQAVGTAAAICARDGLLPRDIGGPDQIQRLQRALARRGQHMPGLCLKDPGDLAQSAAISASSRLILAELPPDGGYRPLDVDSAMLLPVGPGRMPQVTYTVNSKENTTLHATLATSGRADGFTPDVMLSTIRIDIPAGQDQRVTLGFSDVVFETPRYVFVCLAANPAVSVQTSDRRVTGILAVRRAGRQEPPHNIGVDAFDFWLPERRPGGQNFAMALSPPLDAFGAANVVNGLQRPTCGANAWVADFADKAPRLHLDWNRPQSIGHVILFWDNDWDHPAESVLMGHPERAVPFCARRYRLIDARGAVLAEMIDNHQTRNAITIDPPVQTNRLTVEILESWGAASVPASLFEIRCYGAQGPNL